MTLRDLNVQIEALNAILDPLDNQIRANVQEILRIRIPQAASGVVRDRLKKNNLWYTGAVVSGGGQIFREVHSNWDLQTVTYGKLLQTVGRMLAGASYAFTRLINVEDKNLHCGIDDFYKVIRSDKFAPLFHLNEIFAFLPKVSSPYFVKNPLQYLTPQIIPKILQLDTLRLSIDLKDGLACLLPSKLPASSDLLRSIDHLISVMQRRLEISDKIIRLIVKRNDISEPVQFLWYSY